MAAIKIASIVGGVWRDEGFWRMIGMANDTALAKCVKSDNNSAHAQLGVSEEGVAFVARAYGICARRINQKLLIILGV